MIAIVGFADDQTAKPKLKVAADGFPSGHSTPEGAACDLARAFIKRDASLFTKTCIRPYGGGEAKEAYSTFLTNTVAEIKAEAAKKDHPPDGPTSIGKVFAARHLTKDGPASYGFAAFGFQDVMFVDVSAFFQGGKALNRTMVIKDGDGNWFVHPAPNVSPLLSDGLNEESPSAKDFTEAYEIQK